MEQHLKSRRSKNFAGTFQSNINYSSPKSTPNESSLHQSSTAPIPFSPAISHDKFIFYNYDSPFTRIKNAQKNFNSPKFMKMLSDPVSPILDSPNYENYNGFVNLALSASTSTPTEKEEQTQNCSVNQEISKSSQPLSPVDDVLQRNESVHLYSTSKNAIVGSFLKSFESVSFESPPTCYLMEHSNHPQLSKLSAPKPKPTTIQENSSEEDLSLKLQLLNNSQEAHDSLQAEITQVSCNIT